MFARDLVAETDPPALFIAYSYLARGPHHFPKWYKTQWAGLQIAPAGWAAIGPPVVYIVCRMRMALDTFPWQKLSGATLATQWLDVCRPLGSSLGRLEGESALLRGSFLCGGIKHNTVLLNERLQLAVSVWARPRITADRATQRTVAKAGAQSKVAQAGETNTVIAYRPSE